MSGIEICLCIRDRHRCVYLSFLPLCGSGCASGCVCVCVCVCPRLSGHSSACMPVSVSLHFARHTACASRPGFPTSVRVNGSVGGSVCVCVAAVSLCLSVCLSLSRVCVCWPVPSVCSDVRVRGCLSVYQGGSLLAVSPRVASITVSLVVSPRV